MTEKASPSAMAINRINFNNNLHQPVTLDTLKSNNLHSAPDDNKQSNKAEYNWATRSEIINEIKR